MTWKQHSPGNRRRAATIADVSVRVPNTLSFQGEAKPRTRNPEVVARDSGLIAYAMPRNDGDLSRPPVLAVLHEVVDHGGIGQGRGVAERARLVLGDLAQDAAHDLAGAGLG